MEYAHRRCRLDFGLHGSSLSPLELAEFFVLYLWPQYRGVVHILCDSPSVNVSIHALAPL